MNDLVFARISEMDKLRIVNCCRQNKSIVAVTGLASTDIPIFDRSHVRISLKCGTDITKRNSDIILLDDNFASIINGIEEGRVLFENIKKSLCYTLSSKPAELMPYLIYTIFSSPQVASSLTILAIDLFTDNLSPIALGYESGESHVMSGYPTHMCNDNVFTYRTIHISLFFYGIIQFMSGIFAYFVIMGDNGFYFSDILFTRERWKSAAINDYEDSYGQEWVRITISSFIYEFHHFSLIDP